MNWVLGVIIVVVLTTLVYVYLREIFRGHDKRRVKVEIHNVEKGGTVEVSFREEC